MDFVAWIPTAITTVAALAIYAVRIATKTQIEKSIEHKFEARLEGWRSDLRKSEEAFRSQLASRESEISVLREAVLSGRAGRRALIAKRRIEAGERIWGATVDLGQYKFVAMTMAVMKFDAAAKEAVRNPQFREIFKTMRSNLPDAKGPDGNKAKREQPFISPLAWAYFSAYQLIMAGAFAQLKMLELGIEEPSQLFNVAAQADILKAALPHRAAYIDQYGTAGYSNLLDELEKNLLAELARIIEGADEDEAALKQSAAVVSAVDKVITEKHTAESEEQLARAGITNVGKQGALKIASGNWSAQPAKKSPAGAGLVKTGSASHFGGSGPATRLAFSAGRPWRRAKTKRHSHQRLGSLVVSQFES
jgi:hypothetical protein